MLALLVGQAGADGELDPVRIANDQRAHAALVPAFPSGVIDYDGIGVDFQS